MRSTEQPFGYDTLKIVQDVNYLMSPDAGLQVRHNYPNGDATIHVHITEQPQIIPGVVEILGVEFEAAYTEQIRRRRSRIGPGLFACLRDKDADGSPIDVPLDPKTADVDPYQVDKWDDLTKQRAVGMLSRLLRVAFSVLSE